MLRVVWEFRVKPGEAAAFERDYSPGGAWASLFRRSPAYRETVLERMTEDERAYLVTDLWDTREAYERFKGEHAAEYLALDRDCERLTDQETLIGLYDAPEPSMTAAPRVETPRLLMRALENGDAAPLLSNFRDPVASRYWFTPDATLNESLARVADAAAAWADRGYGDWAVVEKESGRFAGFCGLHHISGMEEVNLGYLFGSSFWGRGYATEACRAALRYGFEQARLDLVVGVTHPDNAASIKVLRKCGMSYWKDIVRNGTPRVVYRLARSG